MAQFSPYPPVIPPSLSPSTSVHEVPTRPRSRMDEFISKRLSHSNASAHSRRDQHAQGPAETLPDGPPWELTYDARYSSQRSGSHSDFDRKYPPDRFGEEASDYARVWSVYRDRVTELDADLIDSWNRTLDILLIFAGLFSAVSTAFIIEAFKLLQPDFEDYSTRILLASLMLANHSTIAIPSESQLNPANFVAPTPARWTNGLWMTSLSLSLIVALLAILAKQWLSDYGSRTRAPAASPRHWTWRHRAFSNGLNKWNMEAFISTLPFLLHASLFMFLLGLVVFFTDLDWAIAMVIVVATALTMVFYVVTTVAPVYYGDCPTLTPLLRLVYGLIQRLRKALLPRRYTVPEQHLPAFSEQAVLARLDVPTRDAVAVRWMIEHLPEASDVNVALDAIGSFDIPQNDTSLSSESDKRIDLRSTSSVLTACATHFARLSDMGGTVDSAATARCMRTMLFLGIGVAEHGQIQLWTVVPDPVQTLTRWSHDKTHDNYILAWRTVSTYSDPYFALVAKHVQQWSSAESASPYLQSSMMLVLNTPLRCTWSMSTLSQLLRHVLVCTMSDSAINPIPAQMQLLQGILSRAEQTSSQFTTGTGTPNNDKANLSLFQMLVRILDVWSSVLVSRFGDAPEPGDDVPPPVEHAAYTLTLAHIHTLNLSPSPGDSLKFCEESLEYLGTPGAVQREWSVDALLGAGRLFEQEFMNRDASHWSASLGNIARNLFALFQRFMPNSDLEFIMRNIVLGLGMHRDCGRQGRHISAFATTEEAVSETRLNLLVGGAEGPGSAWRTAFDALSSPDIGYLTPLARLLVTDIAIQHARGADVLVAPLFEELLGGDRTLALLQDEHGLFIAQHAKAISKDWWTHTTSRLLLIPSSEFRRFERRTGYPSPTAFIDAVAKAGCCSACDSITQDGKQSRLKSGSEVSKGDEMQLVVSPPPADVTYAANAVDLEAQTTLV